jgi:hypothetical protein
MANITIYIPPLEMPFSPHFTHKPLIFHAILVILRVYLFLTCPPLFHFHNLLNLAEFIIIY